MCQDFGRVRRFLFRPWSAKFVFPVLSVRVQSSFPLVETSDTTTADEQTLALGRCEKAMLFLRGLFVTICSPQGKLAAACLTIMSGRTSL